ncbi:NAD-dependent epimerase/dehydratase family protein [Agrobacterium rosae]|nr:NAD-dependent epimerase/dehydratase family protein [Agrobacterium rosae]MBN7805913.1 NAD-dependent epimerase/dehydratase family protein [Agrobacterium rosae]
MLVHLVENSSNTRRGAQSSRHSASWLPGFIVVTLWYPCPQSVPSTRQGIECLVMSQQKRSKIMVKTALVVGASGIVGSATANLLLEEGWTVYGLSRRPTEQEGIIPVAANLQDAIETARALEDVRPDAVFISTWARQDSEAENIRVNSAMVRNLLDGLSLGKSTRHVALVTGLKHYLGPFEAYGKGTLPQTPFREEQGRLDVENFYYAQEDEVFAAAKRDGFSWSVHRPHTVIGQAVGNAMNMGSTLAVYASICRETGRPFRFPGSAAQWNGLTDMTDANLLAKQLLWATETPEAKNEAFNVVNGDVFRWSWMWGRIADWFGVVAAPFDGTVIPLEQQMKDDADVWSKIAARENLAEPDLTRLASPWHTDADLGRPIEVVTDMGKSRRLGFREYQPTDDAFFALFETLRKNRLIP